MPAIRTCVWCGRPISFSRGWRHFKKNGVLGGIYWCRCNQCGYEDAPSAQPDGKPEPCPQCGACDWRDLHAAVPAAEE